MNHDDVTGVVLPAAHRASCASLIGVIYGSRSSETWAPHLDGDQGLGPDATSGGPYLHAVLDVILTDGIDVKNVKSGGCQSFLKVTKGWAV
jgi:hypothetical protein